MLDWARQWPERRWAVENARGLGHHLTSWLLARGEQVVDVPPSATARVHQLPRGAGRKNDRIDAAAAACVAALQGDARPVQPERLMKAAGLSGAVRGENVITTVADPQGARAADLVQRDFVAHAANRCWVADFSEGV